MTAQRNEFTTTQPVPPMLGGQLMAEASTTRRQPARLSFEDGQVVVTPKDRDVFVLAAEKAIAACQMLVAADERFKTFESAFLIPLHEWCLAHSAKVSACYIAKPINHIAVFIVGTSEQFDFDLAVEIAALELKLARKGWSVGLSQLPRGDDDTLATYFNPAGALEVYAQRGSAPQKSGE